MEYTFSEGLKNLNPSVIREILKYAAGTSVISLAAGNPSPDAFPTEAVARISERILRERPIDVLQYSITEGYTPLRQQLREYMASRHHVGTDADEIIITAGAQQVMSLLTKAMCNAGDTVICDDPAFVGALNAFRSLGVKLCGVPMQADGMDMDALEAALKAHPNTKFIYTIPNFQNPTGITASLEKRRRMLALAKQYGVLILEDNPYGDLRFEGENVPAIKSMDGDGAVVYAGSFSKVLAPGLHVGYAIGPKAVLQKMTVAKQGEDVHTNIWAQMICDEFMRGDFEAHLQTLRDLYRVKAKKLMSLIEEHLVPYGVTYHPIQGGLFVWCDLPEGADMKDFCTRAVKEKQVAVVPGNAFLADETAACRSIRLNHSTPTMEDMETAVTRLGELAREMFA
ncbi:MAG: PLP-dependent aminotransferase family protein [Clostridia bacterium]|nr:PLP-dependent aminotransferase family protein [Clostridia bacterium]